MKKLLLLFLLIASHPLESKAATYYVATTGSNSNNCTAAQTITTPKLTITNFLTNCTLSAGDTLYLRGGTYAEGLITLSATGTAGSYINISSYPSETATITPSGAASGALVLGTAHYLQITNIAFDCTVTTVDNTCVSFNNQPNVDHIRLSGGSVCCNNTNNQGWNAGCTSTPSTNMSGFNGSTFDGLEILGTKFFQNRAHGMYLSGNGAIIDGVESYQNCLKGMQKYPTGDSVIVRNSAFDRNKDDGLGLYGGTGSTAYNNLIWGNEGAGIVFRYGESGSFLYNNTIYGNASNCASLGCNGGIDDGNGSPTSATIKNNAIFSNTSRDIYTGSPSTYSNNICTLNNTGCASTSMSPGFTDAAGHDFTLTAGSPLIDMGTTVSAVTNDILGHARPVGSAYDVGAYEYDVPPTGSIAVSLPFAGTVQRRPAAVTLNWTVTGISSGNDFVISYSFDSFVTSYTIATGVSWNAGILPSVYTFTPDWPTSSTMKIRVCQGSVCGDSAAFPAHGQYLR